MMDQVGEVGVITPPEYPQLSAPRSLVSPPHTQDVGLQATTVAA